MIRRFRFFAFIYIFAYYLLPITPAFASGGATSAFLEQVSQEVNRATQGRDGWVILRELTTGQEWSWGNAKLAEQKFLPGSLLKLVTAELSLQAGRTPDYYCAGHDKIGGKKMHCWTHHGHGFLDFSRALGISCNLYFAKLGSTLGAAALISALQQAGFSEATSLAEVSWNPARGARLAIGDEPVFRVTPREMQNYWVGLLDRLRQAPLNPLAQGLRRTVAEGTGQKAAQPTMTILGKTGTSDALRTAYKTDGWFLSAYPAENPQWSLLVFLKQAHGFDESAELAGKIWSLGADTGFVKGTSKNSLLERPLKNQVFDSQIYP